MSLACKVPEISRDRDNLYTFVTLVKESDEQFKVLASIDTSKHSSCADK